MSWRAFRYFTLLAALLAVVGAMACASRRPPLATSADAARGAERFPGLTAAQLQDGRSLFTSHCGSCHLPPVPSSQPPDNWHEHIQEMKGRAHLDERQADLVERYLVTMALPTAGGVKTTL